MADDYVCSEQPLVEPVYFYAGVVVGAEQVESEGSVTVVEVEDDASCVDCADITFKSGDLASTGTVHTVLQSLFPEEPWNEDFHLGDTVVIEAKAGE